MKSSTGKLAFACIWAVLFLFVNCAPGNVFEDVDGLQESTASLSLNKLTAVLVERQEPEATLLPSINGCTKTGNYTHLSFGVGNDTYTTFVPADGQKHNISNDSDLGCVKYHNVHEGCRSCTFKAEYAFVFGHAKCILLLKKEDGTIINRLLFDSDPSLSFDEPVSPFQVTCLPLTDGQDPEALAESMGHHTTVKKLGKLAVRNEKVSDTALTPTATTHETALAVRSNLPAHSCWGQVDNFSLVNLYSNDKKHPGWSLKIHNSNDRLNLRGSDARGCYLNSDNPAAIIATGCKSCGDMILASFEVAWTKKDTGGCALTVMDAATGDILTYNKNVGEGRYIFDAPSYPMFVTCFEQELPATSLATRKVDAVDHTASSLLTRDADLTRHPGCEMQAAGDQYVQFFTPTNGIYYVYVPKTNVMYSLWGENFLHCAVSAPDPGDTSDCINCGDKLMQGFVVLSGGSCAVIISEGTQYGELLNYWKDGDNGRFRFGAPGYPRYITCYSSTEHTKRDHLAIDAETAPLEALEVKALADRSGDATPGCDPKDGWAQLYLWSGKIRYMMNIPEDGSTYNVGQNYPQLGCQQVYDQPGFPISGTCGWCATAIDRILLAGDAGPHCALFFTASLDGGLLRDGSVDIKAGSGSQQLTQSAYIALVTCYATADEGPDAVHVKRDEAMLVAAESSTDWDELEPFTTATVTETDAVRSHIGSQIRTVTATHVLTGYTRGSAIVQETSSASATDPQVLTASRSTALEGMPHPATITGTTKSCSTLDGHVVVRASTMFDKVKLAVPDRRNIENDNPMKMAGSNGMKSGAENGRPVNMAGSNEVKSAAGTGSIIRGVYLCLAALTVAMTAVL